MGATGGEDDLFDAIRRVLLEIISTIGFRVVLSMALRTGGRLHLTYLVLLVTKQSTRHTGDGRRRAKTVAC